MASFRCRNFLFFVTFYDRIALSCLTESSGGDSGQGRAGLISRSVGGPALKSSRAGGRKQKQENGPRGPGAPHENRHIPSAREVVTVVTVM